LLAREHGSVLLVTKGSIDDCNTSHAQGGIAAAISAEDSPTLHYQDTIAASAGLYHKEAVRLLTQEASQRIADLVRLGVPFDTANGQIALAREAAHSTPRILHAGGDATGAQIENTLTHQIKLAQIPLLEHCLATNILLENQRVCGLETLDTITRETQRFWCRHLILATGGAGQLFRFTTNPDVATCDGVALAYNAGAEIIDMEFFQFHPTALHLPGIAPFLISEAVRGEGGILRNASGKAFMKEYTPQAELAPRDIVTRGIISEMSKTNSTHVFLDITHLPQHISATRFPQIFHHCLARGLNISQDMIPVSPAAHYMIGGIRVNTWGESSLHGLFAAGETACTGAHGANRLASNSLLEVLVFSKRIIDQCIKKPPKKSPLPERNIIRSSLKEPNKSNTVSLPKRSSIQQIMWQHVGIIRSNDGLDQATSTLSDWQKALPAPNCRQSWEEYNMILAGRLMAEAALLRTESRGAHYRVDYPKTQTSWNKHIVFRKESAK